MKELVERISLKAAKTLRENFGKEGIDEVIGYHGSDSTRIIDKISEDFIIKEFLENGIKATFVSEESGVIEKGKDYVILIDPLDGSMNFISGVPWSSVSIAVYERGNSFLESVTGAVVNVFTGEIYSYDARLAYINGRPVKRPDRFRNVILLYFNRGVIDYVSKFVKSLDREYKFRSYGSASLDMIQVCTGRAALYADVRGKLRNIDIAASSNFCERLGIVPIDVNGRPLDHIGINDVYEVKETIISPHYELLSTFLRSVPKASP